jgi:nucleoside-diphosphate-sugar epimerase
VPRIIQKARAGRLKRIGSRPCPADTVYIDNAAKAHLLAADRLQPGAQIAGKAYFITNDEPVPLWEMVDRILAAGGLPPVRGRVSADVARMIGIGCEKLWGVLKLSGEPPMTRFVANELSTAHWFDISAAKRDLGYSPEITIEEGLKRLRVWLPTSGLLPEKR